VNAAHTAILFLFCAGHSIGSLSVRIWQLLDPCAKYSQRGWLPLTQTTISSIETRFITWAQTQEDVRAAVVVGSQARSNHPADKWSDLDIILFLTDTERLQNDVSWLNELGPLWLSQAGRTVNGDPERLTLFEGGVQVDFVFNSVGLLSALPHLIAAGQLPEIIYRGVRVLFDKDNLIPPMPQTSSLPAATPPTAEQFRQTLESFWFNAVYCAKQLCRSELWLFQNASGGMLWPLLRMVEWHAHATHGWNYDTWHAGKFIAEWADTATYSALQGCFARLDAEDSRRAMAVRLDLFHSLAMQVAEKVMLPYPQDLQNRISQLIHQL
jgi:aminoglycoside 6-adenylyltransferase